MGFVHILAVPCNIIFTQQQEQQQYYKKI